MTGIHIPNVVWRSEPSLCVDTWRPAAQDSGCCLTATRHSAVTIPDTLTLPAGLPRTAAQLQHATFHKLQTCQHC